MKTEITRETVLSIATELAFGESNRVLAQRDGDSSCETFWENRACGLIWACNILLGARPAVYMVENVERPYVVVSFECPDAESEFYFDAETFELIR